MKTNAKRVLSLFLALVLLCGALVFPAGAATSSNLAAAQELYRLGLFQGNGTLPDGSPDFNLSDTATRAQAAVMLVRLLGAEQEALTQHYRHPFTDGDWASDYIGYVYVMGIANGVTNTTFGTNSQITAAQFLTLVLRALGYSQVDWRNPYPTAQSAGLSYSVTENFLRGDMAAICFSALSCTINGTGRTLRQHLAELGVIQTVEPSASGFTAGPVAPTVSDKYTIPTGSKTEDILTLLISAVEGRVANIVLTGPFSKTDECEAAIKKLSTLCSDIRGYSWESTIGNSTMTMNLKPLYTDAVEIMAYLEGKRTSLSKADAMTLEKARQVHASLVKPGMSEYDQVKAFHDYLANTITYGGNTDRQFTAGGALVDGLAVCDGYAMALDLLCYFSGIECTRITGSANGKHAWNKVKVNGSWYNVDVTWDDTGSSPSYNYFLISDSAIRKTHTPNSNPYWPAAPASWPGR